MSLLTIGSRIGSAGCSWLINSLWSYSIVKLARLSSYISLNVHTSLIFCMLERSLFNVVKSQWSPRSWDKPLVWWQQFTPNPAQIILSLWWGSHWRQEIWSCRPSLPSSTNHRCSRNGYSKLHSVCSSNSTESQFIAPTEKRSYQASPLHSSSFVSWVCHQREGVWVILLTVQLEHVEAQSRALVISRWSSFCHQRRTQSNPFITKSECLLPRNNCHSKVPLWVHTTTTQILLDR